MARRKTDTDQLKIRLPADLRKRIEDAALEERRSINAEISMRLYLSFLPESTVKLNVAAKTFLDLAITFLLPPEDAKQTPQELARRRLTDAKLAALLAPAPPPEMPDEDEIALWLKIRGADLQKLGRTQEAERAARMARMLEVLIEHDRAERPRSESPQSGKPGGQS